MENLMCFAVGLVAIVLVVCAWRGYFMSTFALRVAQGLVERAGFESIKKGKYSEVFFAHLFALMILSVFVFSAWCIGCEITKQWRKAYPSKDEYSIMQNYAHPNSYERQRDDSVADTGTTAIINNIFYRRRFSLPTCAGNFKAISKYMSDVTVLIEDNMHIQLRCEKNGKWTVVE